MQATFALKTAWAVILLGVFIRSPASAEAPKLGIINPKHLVEKRHPSGISDFTWSNTSDKILYSIDFEGVLLAYDVIKKEPLWQLNLRQEVPQPVESLLEVHYLALAISQDSTLIYVGDSLGGVTEISALLGTLTGRQFNSGKDGLDPVVVLATHPSSNLLVAGTGNGELRFWRLDEGEQPIFSSREHTWPVHSLHFSRDGEFLVSADPVRTLLWKANEGRVADDLSQYLGHTFPNSFTFSFLSYSPQDDAVLVPVSSLGGYQIYSFATKQATFVPISIPEEWLSESQPERDESDNSLDFDITGLSQDRRRFLVISESAYFVFDPETGEATKGWLELQQFLPPRVVVTSRMKLHPQDSRLFATSRVEIGLGFEDGELQPKFEHTLGIFEADF